MSTLKCHAVHPDGRVLERDFSKPVVKIGSLASSDLCIDGGARMHAVLEEQMVGAWRVITLGASVPTVLDGERVERNAEMGERGTLRIGDWRIDYEVVPTSEEETREQQERWAARRREKEMRRWDADHHRTLMRGLCDELGLGERDGTRQILEGSWGSLDHAEKRERLRTLVRRLRRSREDSSRHERQRIASLLELGPEGLAAIYDLTPDEAVAKGAEALMSICAAKDALAHLDKIDILGAVERGSTSATEADLDELRRGHARLVERLEVMMAAGSSLMLACINRAGGHELSDAERAELKRAFDKMQSAARPRGPTLV